MNYQDINALTIDRWVKEGWEWGKPVSHEAYEKALAGDWQVFLTPTKPVPREWFGELRGKKVLGLASGGAQQMPLFAAAGACCTVLDYSSAQLGSERAFAAREGYEVTIVRADMTKPLPFADGSFDLIFHPVSNSYVEEVKPIFRECFRILKSGGVFLAGLDNGVNFIFDNDEKYLLNTLPFNPLKNPEQRKQLEENDCGLQFSHTLDEQLGGQLEAGFVLTHLFEDTNGEGPLHEHHIPSFIATRAVKPL
jgi:SAM-dependent methyltransferase